MIVIARNNGPFCDNFDGTKERRGLIEGKSYDVIGVNAWNEDNIPHKTQSGEFLNPKNPKFFIKVINENNAPHDYWNDYFLSTEEMRDCKLNKILCSE